MTKKQKYDKISEKKLATPVDVLCKVHENPDWAKFGEYLAYCKNLKFDQRPDYSLLRWDLLLLEEITGFQDVCKISYKVNL